MIVTSLVGGIHKQTILTHENAGQIHCLVNTIRSSISLKTIDADLRWRVQVPAWFRPQWLDMAVVAFRFSAKQLISTFRGRNIEVHSGFGRGSGNSELIEV